MHDKIISSIYGNLQKEAGLTDKLLRLVAKLAPKTTSKSKEVFWGLGNLGEFAKDVSKGFKGGFNKGIENLSRYAKPEFTKTKSGKIYMKVKSKGTHGQTAGVVQRILGSTARELQFLTKDLKANKGFIKNINQLGKNLYEDTTRQLRNSRYRTFDLSKSKYRITANRKGQKVVRNVNRKFFKDRKIVGYTKDGKPITKKRLPAFALSASVTPVGFTATTALSGDYGEAARDYFEWKTPVGPIRLTKDLLS